MAVMIPQSGGGGKGVEYEYLYPSDLVNPRNNPVLTTIFDNGGTAADYIDTQNYASSIKLRLLDTYVNYDNPCRYLSVAGGYDGRSGSYRELVSMLIINPKGQKDIYKKIISTDYSSNPGSNNGYGIGWETTFGDDNALTDGAVIVNATTFDSPQIMSVHLWGNNTTEITSTLAVDCYMPFSSATINNRLKKKTVYIDAPSIVHNGLNHTFAGMNAYYGNRCFYIDDTDSLYIPIMYANGTGASGTNKVCICIYKIENIFTKFLNDETLTISKCFDSGLLDRVGTEVAYENNKFRIRYSVRKNNILSVCMGLTGNLTSESVFVVNINLNTDSCDYVTVDTSISNMIDGHLVGKAEGEAVWIKNKIYYKELISGTPCGLQYSSANLKYKYMFNNLYLFNEWNFTTGERLILPEKGANAGQFYEYEFDREDAVMFGDSYTDTTNYITTKMVIKDFDLYGMYLEKRKTNQSQQIHHFAVIDVDSATRPYNCIKNIIKPIKMVYPSL